MKAQLALRDQILSGALRPGERISELQAVETTGASRTPVRMALVRLEEEGPLEAIPSGGFMVKAFSERDISDSIELRGTLEGLRALRRRARRLGARARAVEGVPRRDRRIAAPGADLDRRLLVLCRAERALPCAAHELSRGPPLIRQIDRASALPFASPSGFVMAQSALLRRSRS